jgi:predicted nucleic acid-binding protein
VSHFVVDTDVVLKLLTGEIEVSAEHKLLAPTLIRSELLSALYSAVRRGEMTEEEGLELHERFSKMRIRLLGDAVMRRLAWRLAAQLGLDSTYPAEYVALTRLQADAYVTTDDVWARKLEGVVDTAGIDALS